MSDGKFQDFIPEGEDTGAIGADGFRDWVPGPEPKPQDINEPVQPVTQQSVPEVVQEPVVTVAPLDAQEGQSNGS